MSSSPLSLWAAGAAGRIIVSAQSEDDRTDTGPVYTRDSYSAIGAVGYDDWESDLAKELVIHTDTGCIFALAPATFPSVGIRFFARRDGNGHPMPPPYYVGTLAASWASVFGFTRPIDPRGFG